MSDDRVTRSGRRSYPPSPSKSVERRSSTDSSSSERVTRSGKRLRTSDSEDENPGSPRKSNPPSPSKRIKVDATETSVKGSKRPRVGEGEDALELSPIKENHHDGDRSPPVDIDALPGDDSDPEVSFKENSIRAEGEKTEEELLAGESDVDDVDLKEEKELLEQDDSQDVPAETSTENECVTGSVKTCETGTTAGNKDKSSEKDVEKETDQQPSGSVSDQTMESEHQNEEPKGSGNLEEPTKTSLTESNDSTTSDKEGGELENVDKTSNEPNVAKKDDSGEKVKLVIPKTNDKEIESSDNVEIDKPVEVKGDHKSDDAEMTEVSTVAKETKGNSDDVEEMDVDKPHDLSANKPQDLSVTKNNVDGEKDKENNAKNANRPDAESQKEKERIQRLREEGADSSSSDDVIVLSDDSSGPMMNGVSDDSEDSPRPSNGVKKLTPDEMTDREKLVRQLQEDLRNEEAKLLLLKKLRQSQLQPVLVKEQVPNQGAVAGKLPIPRNPSAPPPPLLRGGGHPMMKSQQVIMPPLVRGNQIQPIRTQGSQGPPPLMLGRSGGVHMQQQSQMVRPPIVRVGSGSNLVAYGSSTPTYTLVQQGQSQQQVKISPAESPASRQAAAKLALRKQLEKTLLQIPPPKPPPPEMHFLPSAANNEFIYLVGLEEVVNRITEDMTGPKTPKFIEPFTCSQCKLDFTTVWKRDPKKSSAVMCETCVVTNQKKALKAEHTNRLKTAFVKALQQEQEIEQRMSQSVASVPANGSQTQAPQAHTSHHREQLQKVQQEQMRQHHQMLQAHQQQMQRHHVRPVYGQIPQAHIQPTITYAYHVPQVMMTKPQVITTLAQPTDRQREYLLDMIPSRSISQTVAWKQ